MKDLKAGFLFLMVCAIIFVGSQFADASAEPVFRIVYVVQEGDNLTTISRKFDTRISLIRKANQLKKDTVLLPGDELFVPLDEEDIKEKNMEWPDTKLFSEKEEDYKLVDWSEYPIVVQKEPVKVNIPRNKRIIYHVKPGDNLYELAREFNTSMAVIKSLNNMDNSIIRIGQKIILPINNLSPKQVIAKTISNRELNLLARVVHGEARGEPYMGKVAVAAVILNRVLNPYYPNTIEGVIHQSGQFESVSNGQYNLQPYQSSYRAARDALNGFDPSLGAIYFINPRHAKNAFWFHRRQKTVTIGEHVFAK